VNATPYSLLTVPKCTYPLSYTNSFKCISISILHTGQHTNHVLTLQPKRYVSKKLYRLRCMHCKHVSNDSYMNNPFLHLHTLLRYTFHKRVYLHFLNAKLSYHISLMNVLVSYTDIPDCITISRLVKRIYQVLTQQLGVEIFWACTSVWSCTGINLRHVWIRRGDHLSYSRPRYQAKRRLPVGLTTEGPFGT